MWTDGAGSDVSRLLRALLYSKRSRSPSGLICWYSCTVQEIGSATHTVVYSYVVHGLNGVVPASSGFRSDNQQFISSHTQIVQ